eukprot:1125773-Prorocentrum_minimum.AAC.1
MGGDAMAQLAVFIYVIVVSLLYQKNYLVCETPTARARVKPFWPRGLSDTECRLAGEPRTGLLFQPSSSPYRVEDRLRDTTLNLSCVPCRKQHPVRKRLFYLDVACSDHSASSLRP